MDFKLKYDIPMAIMQFFTKRFQKKKEVDQQLGLEKLTCDGESKVDVLRVTNRRGSRKWSATLSTIYTEDNIFQNQFSNDIDEKKSDTNSKDDDGTNSPRKWTQIMSLLPVYLLQISYGMNTGYPAIITPQLEEPCSEFNITSNEESWIVSLDNTATPIVCILSGFLQQRYGPLRVLEFACLPYTIAWLIAALSTSATHLYISRILVGVSHALLATTVYTVEVASKEMRGTYSLWEAVLRCFGCLMVYTLGYFMRWNRIAIFALGVPVIAGLVALATASESPVYLVAQNKIEEANKALTRLYGPKYNVPEEVEIIRLNLKRRTEASVKSGRRGQSYNAISHIARVKNNPEVYKPFFIILFLIFIQQFSGMSILRAYVVKIFDEIFANDNRNQTSLVGDCICEPSENISYGNNSIIDPLSDCSPDAKTSDNAYLSAIVIGFVRLLSSLLLSQLLLKYRRRSMYFVSAILTIISLVSFATCDLFIENQSLIEGNANIRNTLKWLSLVTACCLVFSVQLGIQTLPFLLSGELFPSDIRAFCKGLTRSFACLLLIGSLKMFPSLENWIGIHGTFYSFSVVMLVCTPVIYCIVPETKDLSLEMVENYFLPNRTRFYIDLNSLKSNRGSIVSTESAQTISSKVITDVQSRYFDSTTTEELSDRNSPESIQNTQYSNYSSDNICNTDLSRYSFSHSPVEPNSTPDLYAATTSNNASSLTASTHQHSTQHLNNGHISNPKNARDPSMDYNSISNDVDSHLHKVVLQNTERF